MKGYLSRISRVLRHLVFPVPHHKQQLPENYDQFIKDFSPYPQSLHGVTYFLHYKKPLVKDFIEEIKRYYNKDAFDFAGKTFSQYINTLDTPAETPIYLIPLPQTKARLRERGYDVTQQLIRATLDSLDINDGMILDGSNMLTHTRSQHQSGFSNRNKRMEKARGMFRIDSTRKPPHGSLCILIDDVCTTGASMQEAGRLLHEDGYTVLDKITLAHS